MAYSFGAGTVALMAGFQIHRLWKNKYAISEERMSL